MEKVGFYLADVTVANSAGCRSQWIDKHGKLAERMGVLPSNIQETSFNKEEQRNKLLDEFGLTPDKFLISTSGVLVKRKNNECLISAIEQLKDSRAVLFIIGDGVERKPLESLAKDKGVEGQIIFTGMRDDVIPLVQGTDLFIFPSFAEGMAESLLEATNCEVPCLVSSIPENTDVVQNPEQHFPPERTEVLVEKIKRLMEDENYYKELLEATSKDRDRANFDWNAKLYSLVNPLLNNSEPSI